MMLRKILKHIESSLGLIQLLFNRVKTGKNLSVKGFLFIRNRGSIILGNNLKLNSRYSSNPIGGDRNISLVTGKKGTIVIGDNCGLSNCSIISHKEIIIENNVFIGGSTKIYDTDFHSLNPEERITNIDPHKHAKKVIIKSNSFIGAHCIILKGVSVGVNSILGAGSVLTKDIPDNEIWGGNPAKRIKEL